MKFMNYPKNILEQLMVPWLQILRFQLMKLKNNMQEELEELEHLKAEIKEKNQRFLRKGRTNIMSTN